MRVEEFRIKTMRGEVVQVLIKMVSTNEKLSCTNTEGKISKKFERKMLNPQWDF